MVQGFTKWSYYDYLMAFVKSLQVFYEIYTENFSMHHYVGFSLIKSHSLLLGYFETSFSRMPYSFEFL